MTLTINLQSLQKENGMLLISKIIQNMVKEIKIIQALNLKQKLPNQVFMIIQINIFL